MKLTLRNLDVLDKMQISISRFLRLTLVFAILSGCITQRWTVVFASSIILLLTFAPMLFERKYKIYLPLEFEIVIIIFIYTTLYLGELHGYYTKFWWWDVVLHTSSGLALGFAGFLILYTAYFRGKLKISPVWIAIFSFAFAVAIGAVWEIVEFTLDNTLGWNMQKSGLVDTMWDLIVDCLGALITSIIGYFYIKTGKSMFFGRLIRKFKIENEHLFGI